MWKKFFKGLAVAAAGAAAAGAGGAIDQVASAGTADPAKLKAAAISGAVIGISGWLLKSPREKKPSEGPNPNGTD